MISVPEGVVKVQAKEWMDESGVCGHNPEPLNQKSIRTGWNDRIKRAFEQVGMTDNTTLLCWSWIVIEDTSNSDSPKIVPGLSHLPIPSMSEYPCTPW